MNLNKLKQLILLILEMLINSTRYLKLMVLQKTQFCFAIACFFFQKNFWLPDFFFFEFLIDGVLLLSFL